MRPEIINKINLINQEFYQTFAASFSQTRGSVQPGVRCIIKNLPEAGNWLDIGCGNGTLAAEWVRMGHSGTYFGIDASRALVKEARKTISELDVPNNLIMRFENADFLHDDWTQVLPDVDWQSAFMFAVLHHVPGMNQRSTLCREIREVLGAERKLHLSVWQLQNSKRLVKRMLPWQTAGIEENELETGDVLMDWRAKADREPQQTGLRYVHIFNPEELSQLAADSGFQVKKSFFSDGKEGNLSFYQIWVGK